MRQVSGLIIASTLLLQGCLADIRTDIIKDQGITASNTDKGKAILQKAWKNQGLDQLKNHKVYSFKGEDTWKGMLGRTGKVWPEAKSNLEFKFLIGSFDGQVTFKDGKRAGEQAGLQNWNYYEVADENTLFPEKADKRHVFGISAFQYFTEMLDRLKQAPIINYAGEGEMRGQKYDLVFCTWHEDDPHMEADQYIAWINQTTGMMDFTQYTIRENYLKTPGYKAFYGGVEFSDFRTVDGIKIPHEQTIYVLNLEENKKKFLHQLIITDFTFDGFDSTDLIVDKNIQEGGNFKK